MSSHTDTSADMARVTLDTGHCQTISEFQVHSPLYLCLCLCFYLYFKAASDPGSSGLSEGLKYILHIVKMCVAHFTRIKSRMQIAGDGGLPQSDHSLSSKPHQCALGLALGQTAQASNPPGFSSPLNSD